MILFSYQNQNPIPGQTQHVPLSRLVEDVEANSEFSAYMCNYQTYITYGENCGDTWLNAARWKKIHQMDRETMILTMLHAGSEKNWIRCVLAGHEEDVRYVIRQDPHDYTSLWNPFIPQTYRIQRD
jgi:hypothetical protein